MKRCSYCGRESPDDASHCHECGTELNNEQAHQAPKLQPEPPADLPECDLTDLDLGFDYVDGFSRPDWERIGRFIKHNVPREEWSKTWSFIADQWLQQLARDLGGGAFVSRSQNFLIMSDLGHEKTSSLITYAESALMTVRNRLGPAAWQGYYGKHVLLFFSDQEDYFAYISYFYHEGSHALSAGVFIRSGYAHIAVPYVNGWSAEHTLVHELVHNLLCHLAIPSWLNEGLACLIERQISRRPFAVDRELAERHMTFWNVKNIQEFWSGKSFDVPGDESQLSYSLAEIIVILMSERAKNFADFVQSAEWRDGGQDAALKILDMDLGDVVAGFLGPGNWRPERKAIAEHSKKPNQD